MNYLLFCGAVLGLISVVFGAAGDHFIELTPKQSDSFDTAIRYNMLYAVLIICIALVREVNISKQLSKWLLITGLIFTVGTVLFSFSIYASVITNISEITYIVPFGGLMLMAGWISTMLCSFKK